MLHKIIPFYFFFLSLFCWSQNTKFKAPDYNAIEANIQNQQSEYYYPVLLEKLKTNDTNLTSSQYEHLYYGYLFQNEYRSNYSFSKEKELLAFKEGPTPENILPIKLLLEEALEEFPFDLTNMMLLAYVYRLNGEEGRANKLIHNFQGIVDAIIASGDGLTCETAIHVISVSHEYRMLKFFKLKHVGQSFDGTCDFLKLDADLYKIPGIYFNVSQLHKRSAFSLNL